jgi:hypothetical protein
MVGYMSVDDPAVVESRHDEVASLDFDAPVLVRFPDDGHETDASALRDRGRSGYPATVGVVGADEVASSAGLTGFVASFLRSIDETYIDTLMDC